MLALIGAGFKLPDRTRAILISIGTRGKPHLLESKAVPHLHPHARQSALGTGKPHFFAISLFYYISSLIARGLT